MSTAVIGAPEFRARSGRLVRLRNDGSLHFHRGNGYLGADEVFDAEEFFQAKRDAELGRWRWTENPHYVVYPSGHGGQVAVVDESNGERRHYSRSLCATTAPPSLDGIHAAAHAFFEAHPERKPWVAAKTGEGWAVTLGGEERLATVQDTYFWIGSEAYSVTDPEIADARKVWPEDAS